MSITNDFFYSYFVDRGNVDEFKKAKKTDLIRTIKGKVEHYHNRFVYVYKTNPEKARLEGKAIIALLDSFLSEESFDSIEWCSLTHAEIEEKNKTKVKIDPDLYVSLVNSTALYDAIEPRLDALLTEEKTHAQLLILGQVLEALIDSFDDYDNNRTSLETQSHWTDRHLSVAIKGDEVISQEPELDNGHGAF